MGIQGEGVSFFHITDRTSETTINFWRLLSTEVAPPSKSRFQPLLMKICAVYVEEEFTIRATKDMVIRKDDFLTFMAFKTWHMHHKGMVLVDYFFSCGKFTFVTVVRC